MSHFQYWFLCIIVLICITIWLVRAPQFEPIKRFILRVTPKFADEQVGGFLYCTMCLGFWVGIFGTIIAGVHPIFKSSLLTWIFSGFLVSILSLYGDRLVFGIDKNNNLEE